MTRFLLLIILSVTLQAISGCAGLHSIPPSDYTATAPTNTVRIFFDQWGSVYPKAPPAQMPTSPILGWNAPFSISTHMQATQQNYDKRTVTDLVGEFGRDIIRSLDMNSTKRLYVLIHGYNNSFSEASKTFEDIRCQILNANAKVSVFLEVYWDGLYEGLFTVPIPVWYWFDSMTYSNLVGQVGLRRILNQLPNDTELIFITHSRGAGVAFSALTDPMYDSHITIPNFESIDARRFSSITLIAVAPAIGSGHPLSGLHESLPDRSGIIVGFNANDPVLQKSLLGSKTFGDTSLGASEEFYVDAESRLNGSRKWLQRVQYVNYKEHDAKHYLTYRNGEAFRCLLWSATPEIARPNGCELLPAIEPTTLIAPDRQTK